jgi:hypothetical protein
MSSMPPTIANMGVGPAGPMQHSNWKPIEPAMPKPHQGIHLFQFKINAHFNVNVAV